MFKSMAELDESWWLIGLNGKTSLMKMAVSIFLPWQIWKHFIMFFKTLSKSPKRLPTHTFCTAICLGTASTCSLQCHSVFSSIYSPYIYSWLKTFCRVTHCQFYSPKTGGHSYVRTKTGILTFYLIFSSSSGCILSAAHCCSYGRIFTSPGRISRWLPDLFYNIWQHTSRWVKLTAWCR